MLPKNAYLARSLAMFVFAGAALSMSDAANAGGKSHSTRATSGSRETRKLEKPINDADFRWKTVNKHSKSPSRSEVKDSHDRYGAKASTTQTKPNRKVWDYIKKNKLQDKAKK